MRRARCTRPRWPTPRWRRCPSSRPGFGSPMACGCAAGAVSSEARDVLAQAPQAFESLGSAPWATRTRDGVARRGRHGQTRGGQGGTFSAQERRIAELAAAGHSNKQIAAQLYLSPRTVGAHLYRIFPKLGITSGPGSRRHCATSTPNRKPGHLSETKHVTARHDRPSLRVYPRPGIGKHHMMNRIRLGNATLTRVLELRVELPTSLFASTPPEAWHQNADLLEPTSGTATPSSFARDAELGDRGRRADRRDRHRRRQRPRPAANAPAAITYRPASSSALEARDSTPLMSTWWSTRTCTPTTSAGTPGGSTTRGCRPSPMRAT